MSEKNVHSGHRKRLRDRAMNEGLEAFNPHQVLELLLFYSIPRQDTSKTAHLLIETFGSVHGVLNAAPAELTKVSGVGKKTAQWLTDLGMLVKTYGELRAVDRPKIINLKTAAQFCEDQRERCEMQSAYQLCTTPSGIILVFSKICDSTAWGEQSALRKSMRNAMAFKARNMVVVEYIDEDKPSVDEYHRQCAEKYARTLMLVGSELLDVILVGREASISMNKTGDFDRSKYGGARSILSENYLREDIDLEDLDDGEQDDDGNC